MTMRGKSEILDQLADIAEKSGDQQPRYDIRQLSREILLRTKGDEYTWMTDHNSRLTLTRSENDTYPCYDLYEQHANDPDVHLYTYGSIGDALLYRYPLFTSQQVDDRDAFRRRIEKLLLSGPVHDKVPQNVTERKIQNKFTTTARLLTIAELSNSAPEYRAQMYDMYLAADDEETRDEIVRQLYEKALGLSMLHVGPEQFESALYTDMTMYKLNRQSEPHHSQTE